MRLTERVSSVLAFLRGGYPTGAPALGYAPLLALLPRRVSDDEVATIATELAALKRRSITNVDVGVAITRVTDELPSVDEIERVHRRLNVMGSAGRPQA